MQLTVDHAPDAAYVAHAAAAMQAAGTSETEVEDAVRRLQHSINRYLGLAGEAGEIQVVTAAAPGDVFLLTSDGLDPLVEADPSRVATILREVADPAATLLAAALVLAVPGQDNATAVVVRVV